jgi:hypothetical protein
MKLTKQKLRMMIIKEMKSMYEMDHMNEEGYMNEMDHMAEDYDPDDLAHDMAYGTDSRKKSPMPAKKPQPQKIKSQADRLMQAAMEGDPDAIAMLMAYGE